MTITVCYYEPGEIGVIEAGSEWLTSNVPNSSCRMIETVNRLNWADLVQVCPNGFTVHCLHCCKLIVIVAILLRKYLKLFADFLDSPAYCDCRK